MLPMPKGRSDVALTSPEMETKAKKAYSNAALTARKLSRLEKQQLIDKAAAWCIENECGAKAAAAKREFKDKITGEFKDSTGAAHAWLHP